MNIAIVDDLTVDLQKLKILLEQYASMHRIDLEISCFHSAESFLAEYRPYQYTILFLDIFMDGMTGVEAAGKIREMD